MTQHTAIDALQHLAQVDIDAIRAYTQAIDRCGDGALSAILSDFREDHRRHVADLSEAIRHLGGEPPVERDVAGFFIEGMTAVAASAGRIGALTVMESNEIVTNHAYDAALAAELPAEVRTLVERNRTDEQRHLAVIREELVSTVPGGQIMSAAATAHGWSNSMLINGLRGALPMLMIGAGAGALMAAMMGRPERNRERFR